MLLTPPAPPHPEDVRRWRETGRRYRMLEGEWEDDALEREAEFFDPALKDFLPRPELSRNVFASVHRQTAVLYDEAPTVDATGATPQDLERIVTPELWALCQQRNLYTEGMNESLMRVDVVGSGSDQRVTYRVVPAHMVYARASASRPDRPEMVCELRPRVDPQTRQDVWTWETWDVSNPEGPVFRIEVLDDKGQRVDVTALFARGPDGAPSTAYPYTDATGPILPYIQWHRRVGNRLWSPMLGMELAHGTLTSAAAWTMWLGGLRDGAYPQRYVIDAEIQGASNVQQRDGASSADYVRLNHLALLQLRSKGNGTASVGQFQPAMDPKSFGEGLADFDAGLAVYADVSPADLQVSRGESGYAIVVRREGVRKAQRRQMTPARMGDRQLLATASRMANVYLGTRLPTEEGAWSIRYAVASETPEERRALVEETTTLLGAKLTDPVSAYMRLNPGTTEEEAAAALAKARAVTAAVDAPEPDMEGETEAVEELEGAAETLALLLPELTAAQRDAVREVIESLRVAGQALGASVEMPEPGDDTTDQPEAQPVPGAETVQDTALNGAQVSSLLEVLGKVATGELTDAGALAVIAAAFPGVPEDSARAMVAGVTPAPAPPVEGQA